MVGHVSVLESVRDGIDAAPGLGLAHWRRRPPVRQHRIPRTTAYSRFFKFYYIVLDAVDPDSSLYFATAPYSDATPARFFDDSNPPVEDICTHFGMIRWLTPGYNECPQSPPPAAVEDGPMSFSTVSPNPFVGRTRISFELSRAGRARLEVLDLQGRRIANLFNGWRAAGTQAFEWEATGVGSGVYLVRLSTAERTRSQKLVVLR